MEEVVQKVEFKGRNSQLWILTTPLFFTFGVMGMCSALLGTTYVHLELLFNVSPQNVSYTLVILSIGYLIGGLNCGLIYDRLSKPEIGFIIANAFASIATFVAGTTKIFFIFSIAMGVQGASFGFIDAAGQAYCLLIWAHKKSQKSVLQAYHAIWSLGGILGPFLINLFLVEVSNINKMTNHTDTNFISNYTFSDEFNTKLQKCRSAYVTFAFLLLISAIFFIIAFLKYYSIKSFKVVDNCDKTLLHKPEISFRNFKHLIFSMCIILFAILNLYMENLPICYLVYFALKQLKWSVVKSSTLLSCYYAFLFVGRLTAIVTSIYLKPSYMLLINLSITILSYFLMLFVDLWQILTWVSVILAGFGVSNTFPTFVLWVSDYLKIDGKVGSLLIVSSSIGTITGPYVMFHVISHYTPSAYVYMLFTISVFHAIFFISNYFYSRFAFKSQPNL